ncbi:hypothetical protein P8831_25845 [Priestia megaterium]|uniref:hypothetical protein n=1 Tax=Priestia megaterium TaxID=1404 RepID=UPI002D7E7163|nr:hypothetical protein [Priestia megaterium]MEB4872107.1 hypothetical protein [Priestia megaterium]
MKKRGKGFWIAYLIFAIIMFFIYKYAPAESRFTVIIVFPLVYWFIYEFILMPKKNKRSTDK